MLREIPKPISPQEKELTPATKIDLMSHVGDMRLTSEIWKRFELLYQDTGFIECDSIFIGLSTQTLSDFDDVAQFADNIKQNSIRLKEIGTKDVPG